MSQCQNRNTLPELSFILLFITFCNLNFLSSAYAQTPTVPDTFIWTPWLQAGDKVWNAVVRLEPKLPEVIGDGKHVAVAITDLNFDGQNDIVLYFWGAEQCGADGCTYVVLSNNGTVKRAFTARSVKRQGFGLNVDGRYYKL